MSDRRILGETAKRLNKLKCIASRADEAIRSQESGDRGSVLDLVSDLVKSNKITLFWFPCDCFESFLEDNFFNSEI